MKTKILIPVVLGFLFSVAVSAQDQMPPKGGERMHKKEMRQGEKPQVTPQMRAEKMAEKLKLSDAEKAKVQALFEKQAAGMKKHQEEMTKLRSEMKEKREAQHKSDMAELEKIIGTEKFKQLQEMRIEKLQKENSHMRHAQKNKMQRPDKGENMPPQQ
jgi:periplasmic protein CpxP/Spy